MNATADLPYMLHFIEMCTFSNPHLEDRYTFNTLETGTIY